MSKGESPRNDCDRQLRLILRDDTDNLFVRLSPEVARDLKTLASTTNSAVQESGERCWTIHGEDSDFLPLSISILDQTIYASHNGGFLDESGKRRGYTDTLQEWGGSCWTNDRFRFSCHYHRIYNVDILPLLPSF
jgi:hypothetical protein